MTVKSRPLSRAMNAFYELVQSLPLEETRLEFIEWVHSISDLHDPLTVALVKRVVA